MSALRRAPSRVYHGSEPPSWRRPFDDIPECPEEEDCEPSERSVAVGDCHSPSYRSHDSGFSDSSDQEERRLVSRVYVNCQPSSLASSSPSSSTTSGGGAAAGQTRHPSGDVVAAAASDGDADGAAGDDDRARYAELTRRAGRMLYSRVGGDVTLSPLLARRPHVSTIRVEDDGGGSGGCGPVSVAVSQPPRRRWSLADVGPGDGDEVGELMSGLEPGPGGCRSLPRRHTTVSTCRQQLRAATVRNRAVRQWLQDLGTLCEPECSTTLQSKSLISDVTRLIQLMTDDVSSSLRAIQMAAKAVSQAFAVLCRRLETLPAAELRAEVERLLGLVDRLSCVYRPPAAALRCRQLRPLLAADLEPTRAAVAAAGRRLLAAAEPPQLVAAVTQLGGAITQLVDQLLLQQLRLLTEALRPPHVLSCARAALAAATAAGAQGCHLSGLFCRLGGVRQLVGMATDGRFAPLQLHVLRALSAVCCAVPCVRAMEEEGGVDLVCELLCDLSIPGGVRHEAAAVLAQMTAPWLTPNHSVHGLSRHLAGVVQALTDLAEDAADDEVLLLSAAALANLTFIERQVFPQLTARCTAQKLITAADRFPDNVFILDQVCTVLANAASVGDSCLGRLAVPALIRYLHVAPTARWADGARAACRRLQQKTAVALTRFCVDRRTACHLVSSGGTARLELLCRQPELRGRDDGVLVACLTALRRILSFCPEQTQQQTGELVQPKLMDVFLQLSSGESDDERRR
ncbi:protein inscuteable homolog [Amphibalanus amphitrite]|uniref:protein inscuteable homolog n=1 Tax=Amphibalanus amphitrite TaxID=1232801 RepID=UPI001C903756|nr:protein inscuteable homolog [Amphibalanus amphitrite]